MTLVRQTDHAAAALARRAGIVRRSAIFEAVVRAIASEAQVLEDAIYAVYLSRRIANGVGVQLDMIGRILREPRGNSADDAEYRLRLFARGRANRTGGTTEDVIAVLRALLPSIHARVQTLPPAALQITFAETVTAIQAAVAARFVKATKSGGVNAQVHYTTLAPAATFTFSRAAICAVADVGDDFATVNDTEGFPAAGRIMFDPGIPGLQEIVEYGQKTPTGFQDFTTPLLSTHDAGAIVEWVDGPGLGWSTVDEPELGGGFATSLPAGSEGG